MDIRQTLVFTSRLADEAQKIVSGEAQVIIPFRYGIHKGSRIFLFFPELLPAPQLFLAIVSGISTGLPSVLQTDLLRGGKDIYVLLDESIKDCSSMSISWTAVKIPMSQNEIVCKEYSDGKLPEDPE